MTKIQIDRPNKIFHARTPYQIYIDDKKVGTIGNYENKYFEVEQGEHTVVINMGMGFFMGSPKVLVTVKGGETKRLKVNCVRGVIWLLGLFAVILILIQMQDSFGINRYIPIICPGIFLLYFLTIGRKNYLSLS